MKKQLILVGGAMGVGKSAVCRELLRQLTPGVWLDGDWCWNMNPFVVSEENKRMVLSNITHLLRAYLNNSSYRYVLFCWVMDQPLLFEAVLGPLRDIPFTLHSFSLVCTEQVLRERLERDVRDGIREADVIPRSLRRLPAYAALPTCKLDVTSLTPYEAACAIAASVGRASSPKSAGSLRGRRKLARGLTAPDVLEEKGGAFRQQRRGRNPLSRKASFPPFSFPATLTCSFRSARWRGPAPSGCGRGGWPCRRPCPQWACGRRRCPSRPARQPGAAIR